MALQIESDSHDRRASGRVASLVGLWFAVYDGENFPHSDEFRPGETRNLTALGVSFFVEMEIQTKQKLVLRFGSEEQPIYVSADVVHSQLDRWGRREQYFVGCQFRKRLEKDASK